MLVHSAAQVVVISPVIGFGVLITLIGWTRRHSLTLGERRIARPLSPHFARRLIRSRALIRDLPEKAVRCLRQDFNLTNEFGPNPMDAREKER